MKERLPRATVSIIVPKRGRILYVRDTKYNLWGLPGGKVEFGESFEHAASRELKEETGLRGKMHAAIGTYQFTSNGGNHIINTVFLCSEYKGVIEIMQPNEIKSIRFFTYDELKQLKRQGEIRAGTANLMPVEDYRKGKHISLDHIINLI